MTLWQCELLHLEIDGYRRGDRVQIKTHGAWWNAKVTGVYKDALSVKYDADGMSSYILRKKWSRKVRRITCESRYSDESLLLYQRLLRKHISNISVNASTVGYDWDELHLESTDNSQPILQQSITELV